MNMRGAGVAWLVVVAAIALLRCPRADAPVEAFVTACRSVPRSSAVVVIHPPWRTDAVAACQAAGLQRVTRTLNPLAGAPWPDVVVLADANQPVPLSWSRTMTQNGSADGIDRWERR